MRGLAFPSGAVVQAPRHSQTPRGPLASQTHEKPGAKGTLAANSYPLHSGNVALPRVPQTTIHPQPISPAMPGPPESPSQESEEQTLLPNWAGASGLLPGYQL